MTLMCDVTSINKTAEGFFGQSEKNKNPKFWFFVDNNSTPISKLH